MAKLIITQGIPGSGKSYWATNYKKQNPDTLILELSQIRKELVGKPNYNSRIEKFAQDIELERAVYALLQDKDVIIADTNLRDAHVEFWRSVATKWNAQFVIQVIDTPLEIAIERNAKRAKLDQISEQSIREMYRMWKTDK